jgi:hypothetical protein
LTSNNEVSIYVESFRYDLLGVCSLMTTSSFGLKAATPASGGELAAQEPARLSIHKELLGKLAEGATVEAQN